MANKNVVNWGAIKAASEKRINKSAIDWSAMLDNIKAHIAKNPGLYRNLAIGGGVGALTGGLFGGLKGALGGGVLGMGLGYGSNYLQNMLTPAQKAAPTVSPAAVTDLSRQVRDLDIDNKLRMGRVGQDYMDISYPNWAADFIRNAYGNDVAANNILNPGLVQK